MNQPIRSHHPRPRILVLEDEQGMRTSYYPGLAWNDMGYSFPAEQKGSRSYRTDEILLKNFGFLADKTQKSDSGLVDIDRSQKIFSAKNILRDINRQYKSVIQNYPFASEMSFLKNQAYLHSNLLYLIAATDDNDDTVGHSQLVARYTLLLTKALEIDDRTFSV